MDAELQIRKRRRLEKIFRLQSEFLESALADTKEILALIDGPDGAMGATESSRLKKLAHDLRGTGAAFGFASLSDTAARLENAFVAENPADEVRRCIDDLMIAVSEARSALRIVPGI